MSKDEPPRVTIAELLGTKYRLEIDPADPLLLVADIVGEMQKEALDRLGAVVKEAADQIATSAVLAENSARARSGTIITDAARWAAEQIRLAGDDAGQQTGRHVEVLLKRAEHAARRATIAAWISSSTAVVALAFAAFVVLR